MAPETRARKALVDWMAEDPETRTQVAIARAMRVSQPSVADWINRRSRPKPRYRPGLKKLTGGAVRDEWWLTKDEEVASAAINAIKPMRRAG